MNDNDPPKPLSDLLDAGTTMMVGTPSPDGLTFRPLTVAAVDGDRIAILVDMTAPWATALVDGDTVYVTVSDTRDNRWLWLVGRSSLTTEDAAIDELWNPFASVYFENGRETPGIGAMYIDGESGGYWSTPSGRIGSLISMVKAKLGDPEESGRHGEVDLGSSARSSA